MFVKKQTFVEFLMILFSGICLSFCVVCLLVYATNNFLKLLVYSVYARFDANDTMTNVVVTKRRCVRTRKDYHLL